MQNNSLLEGVINSYDDRILKIQTAFQSSEDITESTHLIFANVQNSLNSLKKERETLNFKLSQAMAKNGSLRIKDYNIMMSDVLNLFKEKELDTETQFFYFIEELKKATQSLKNRLLDIKDTDYHQTSEKITIIKEQVSQITELQGSRKEKVIKSFTDFQQMHNRVILNLEDLLKKGENVQVKDIKFIKKKIIREIN
jgi:polyhydroxyalkanoate synthesis regulator phasin